MLSGLTSENALLKQKVSELEHSRSMADLGLVSPPLGGGAGGTPALFGSSDYMLSDREKMMVVAVVNEVLAGSSFMSLADMETMLANRQYVSESRLSAAIPTPSVLPPRLSDRLNSLEAAVIRDGGGRTFTRHPYRRLGR